MRKFRQDKGQLNCAKEFVAAIQQAKTPPIPFEDLIESSKIAIKLVELLNNK